MTPFNIGHHKIEAGERRTIDLAVSVLANHTPISLPVHVINGKRKGPTLFICGAVHGDEILGVEIVRRLAASLRVNDLAGTLLAVPIVNAFGFITHSRYMPDRRDLNRSFPGSDRGSLASLLADLFLKEVVLRSDFGIDLHTAALHRVNLPQLRIAPDENDLLDLAQAFHPPVILISKLREGTLRACAQDKGVKVILYEAGEALRFNEEAIELGVQGSLRVMQHIGMIADAPLKPQSPPHISTASAWLRAPEGGIFRTRHTIGNRIDKDEAIGEISGPLGNARALITADADGIIIGATQLPVVNRGDALFHVARLKRSPIVQPPLFDEDEII